MTYYSQPQPETPARRQQGQVCRLQKTISAVLVAAGSSTRMGFDKLSFDLGGETVLHRSIRAFDQCPQIGEIVLVAGKNRAFVEQQAVGCTKPVQIVAGGATRAESAKNGVLAAHGELVAVHDAARPFVSPAVIAAVLEAAARCGAAAPAVPVKDTIKQAMPGDGKTVPEACLVHSTPDRSTLYAVQTPQCFDRAQYLAALQELDAEKARLVTDDCSLFELTGRPVELTPGDYANKKITTREDLPCPVQKEETKMHIGHGYDVHRLVEGRKLILGGVEIPFEKGLLGHSDADVLTHAVMDAVLGRRPWETSASISRTMTPHMPGPTAWGWPAMWPASCRSTVTGWKTSTPPSSASGLSWHRTSRPCGPIWRRLSACRWTP